MNPNKKNEAGSAAFDLSDTPDQKGRRGAPAVRPPKPKTQVQATPTRPAKAGPQRQLPGVRQEATPFDAGQQGDSGATRSARSRAPTQQMTPVGPQRQQQANSWDVQIGDYRYTVPHHDPEEAKQAVIDLYQKENPGIHVAPAAVKATPSGQNEASTGGDGAGFQAPGDDFKEKVREMVREIVRKKSGGGGYNLYPPNKGKKKKGQKAVGTFATRTQAKEAELQRFPPKDPEQLKRARERLAKLRKDPKRRIEKEKGDLTGGKKQKKSGPPARDRKKVESIAHSIAQRLAERLFREDEIPGSPWDEKLDSLNPDALASDKKLDALHREMQAASVGALGDGHKAMAKALRGIAKVHPGEHAFDSNRKKMYLPVHLEVDGTEVGPVHLYVDGGHVKVELSNDARQQIAALEPGSAKDVRGGLMAVEEDHLPKIDRAKRAWNERDKYLDKVHSGLEKRIGGMSGVEAHLAKGLLAKHGRGKK